MPLMLRRAVAAAAVAGSVANSKSSTSSPSPIVSIESTPTPSSLLSSAPTTRGHREHLTPATTIAIVVSVSLLIILLCAHWILLRTCRSYAILFGKTPPPSKKALGKRRASGEQIEMWSREAGGNPPFRILDGEAVVIVNRDDNRSSGGTLGTIREEAARVEEESKAPLAPADESRRKDDGKIDASSTTYDKIKNLAKVKGAPEIKED